MNNLFRKNHDNQVAQQVGLSTNELMAVVKRCSAILWKERETRVRPGLDNKILASWNGLMLSGLVKSYRVFNDPEFLDLAIKNAAFMKAHLINKDGSVNRNYAVGKKPIPGFLDDYAFTIEAFIELYQATFEEHYLDLAKRILDKAIELFYDKENGMFFYTASNGEALVARKMELSDQVIPASNSAMANCLYKLGYYFNDTSYSEKSRQMLMNIQGKLNDYPPGYSNWMNILLNEHYPPFEILISGNKAKEQLAELDKQYIPNMLIGAGIKSGKLPIWKDKENEGIYICRNNTCQLPAKTVEEALVQLK